MKELFLFIIITIGFALTIIFICLIAICVKNIKTEFEKTDKSNISIYAVVAVNPDMFSYYTEITASSLSEAGRLGLDTLSRKYPEETFNRVEVELIE